MTSYTVNASILLTDLPLLERAGRRDDRQASRRVEFWWPFPEAVPADRDVDAFVDTLSRTPASS